MNKRGIANSVIVLYSIYLILPLYWLLSMSIQTSQDITTNAGWYPANPTLVNFQEIFTNPVWYQGFLNSLTYVLINTTISIVVALPAAYAFSRYRFLGDKHLFFWLLSNRMAPPAVFLLPFLTCTQVWVCLIRLLLLHLHIVYSPSRWLCGYWRGLCLLCHAR